MRQGVIGKMLRGRYRATVVVEMEISLPAADLLEASVDGARLLEDRLRDAGLDVLDDPVGVIVGATTEPLFELPPAGSGRGWCKACGDAIWWGRASTGTPVPLNRDGTLHLRSCRSTARATPASPQEGLYGP